MIKLWFSYGIQPGSALILIGFIGTVLCLMTVCIDYVELAVGKSVETKAFEAGPVQVIVELFVLLEFVAHVTCLGYGVIVRGIQQLLKVWIAVAGVYMLIWEIQLIWFLIEDLSYDLAPGKMVKITLVLIYFIIYTAIYYGYAINLGVRCLPLLNSTSITDLEPIGKGFQFIIDYYKTNTKAAASLALMSEIMLNLHVFLERHVTEYGIGFDYMDDETDRSTALTIEETFVRYIRVGVCIIGFFLVYKERRMWMFNWCLAYLATLTLSLGILVYMTFMWRAVHSLLTLVYFSTFTLNLLYRTGVLCVCIRYSDMYERQRGLPL